MFEENPRLVHHFLYSLMYQKKIIGTKVSKYLFVRSSDIKFILSEKNSVPFVLKCVAIFSVSISTNLYFSSLASISQNFTTGEYVVFKATGASFIILAPCNKKSIF